MTTISPLVIHSIQKPLRIQNSFIVYIHYSSYSLILFLFSEKKPVLLVIKKIKKKEKYFLCVLQLSISLHCQEILIPEQLYFYSVITSCLLYVDYHAFPFNSVYVGLPPSRRSIYTNFFLILIMEVKNVYFFKKHFEKKHLLNLFY